MRSSIISSIFFAVVALATPLASNLDDGLIEVPSTSSGLDDGGETARRNSTLKTASKTAAAAGLTSLVGALTTAGLLHTVDGLTNVTIFAPTNAAFAKISNETSGLSKEALGAILKHHIVKGVVKFAHLKNSTKLTTLNGAHVTISRKGKKAMVDHARVVKADVGMKHGVIHVIDDVLVPSTK